jgi:tetratricopeptide (TPR) repeat protein
VSSRKILIGILALTALIYLPGVIRNDFVSLDDMLLIVNNDKVHGIDPEHVWRIFTSYDPELYVPLTLLTYQIEYTIAGLHPFLYHLDNLLLHLGSIILVFAVLIFALHPLNAETVSWAAARKDLLSGFLILLSLWQFLRYRETESKQSYQWSIGFFVLALMAKVSVILIPFSILFLDLLCGDFRKSKGSREFLPFAGIALIFGGIAVFGKTIQFQELGFLKQVLLSCKALAFALSKFLIPTGLSVYHPQLSPVTITAPEFLASVVLVILLGTAAIVVRKSMPLLTFGLLFALVAILPSFMNFWKKDTIYFLSERYVYIASIGLALTLGVLLLPVWRRCSLRIRPILASIVVLGLSGMTFAQAQTWQGSVALYTRALAVYPGFPVALNNLGAATYTSGDTARAVELYEEAIMRDPTLTSGYNNIALHRRKSGDIEGALAMIRTGLENIPANRPALEEEIKAWHILGSLLDERGMREEALTAYRKAVERAPKSGNAHYNLAVTLQKYRLFPESREHFTAYLAIVPRDMEARYRLAAVEAELGLLPEAAKNLRIIVTSDPDYEKAEEHLERIRGLMEE